MTRKLHKSGENGWAYVLRVVGPMGPVKIGFTRMSPMLRARAIEMACPYPIEWVAAWRTTKRDDLASLHRLRSYAIKREWFHPVIPVLDFIREKCPEFDRAAAIREMSFADERERFRSLSNASKRDRIRDLHRLCDIVPLKNEHLRSDLRSWIISGHIPNPECVAAVDRFIRGAATLGEAAQ